MASWRDKIRDAAEGVERAYDTRRSVFKEASDAGLSMRQIADAAGISAAMVCRDIGNAKTPRTSLDDEAPNA
jgi:AcrR family transcriptional regulator